MAARSGAGVRWPAAMRPVCTSEKRSGARRGSLSRAGGMSSGSYPFASVWTSAPKRLRRSSAIGSDTAVTTSARVITARSMALSTRSRGGGKSWIDSKVQPSRRSAIQPTPRRLIQSPAAWTASGPEVVSTQSKVAPAREPRDRGEHEGDPGERGHVGHDHASEPAGVRRVGGNGGVPGQRAQVVEPPVEPAGHQVPGAEHVAPARLDPRAEGLGRDDGDAVPEPLEVPREAGGSARGHHLARRVVLRDQQQRAVHVAAG